MVELNIMFILMMIFVTKVVQVHVVTTPLVVGMVVAVSMMFKHWFMDCMVCDEVSIVLDSVNIVLLLMSWMECFRVREVIISSVVVLSNVVMSVLNVVSVSIMMRALMVHSWLMDTVMVCIAVGNLVWGESVCICMSVSISMIIMTSMISFMSWVIDVTMCFVSSHFMLDIENMVRKFMVIMSVMIMVVINNSSLSMIMDMLFAIVIFTWNIMELSVFMVHIMAMVGTMGPTLSVMYFAMMAIFMVVSESVMLISNMSSIAVVVSVMFTVGWVLVVVISSIMSMDVSWAIFIMMCLGMSIVVGLCKDLIETMGAMSPSLAVMCVWVVAIVVAFVSPVGFGVIFTKVFIKTVVMATMFMVHVMVEIWVMIIMMTVSIVMIRVWVSVVTMPVVMV